VMNSANGYQKRAVKTAVASEVKPVATAFGQLQRVRKDGLAGRLD
jgi:hypothetical protein